MILKNGQWCSFLFHPIFTSEIHTFFWVNFPFKLCDTLRLEAVICTGNEFKLGFTFALSMPKTLQFYKQMPILTASQIGV